MAPKRDTEDGITWNNENTLQFCEVYIDYVTKNGRGQQIRWRDLENLFAKKIGKRHSMKSLKNKYDSLKKDWRLWKFLKTGETGLGWNPTTGRLDCSDEWWERKLKEKPEAKKYRHKGVCPLLEEKWDQLFGDAVATGADCVAPSMNPIDKTPIDVDEVQDGDGLAEDAYREYSQYDRIASLDNEVNNYWQGFTEEVSGNLVPTTPVARKPSKPDKRRKRESGGSALMREHIAQVHERHSEIVDLIKQGRNNKKDEVATIDQMMDIMNRICTMSDVEVGSDIWCHAMVMFRDPTNRELFAKMPSDDARLAWLKFARTEKIT